MKTKYLLGFACFFIISSCGKDKFETRPHIEIKSVNTEVVAQNQDLTVQLRITDKEGDVKDSVIVIRERLNKLAPNPKTEKLAYKIPDFPDNSKIDMQVDLAYSTALTLRSSAINIPGTGGVQHQPDTLNLKFVVIDNAKNVSDTVSQKIIVIR